MIVNNAKTGLNSSSKGKEVRLYDLKLKHQTVSGVLEILDLTIYGDNQYPTNPVYYDKTGQYEEVYLHELLKNGISNLCIYRSVIIGSLEDLLYDTYKSNTLRSAKKTKEFVRWVIKIALLVGYNNKVISVYEFALTKIGMKKQAARETLKRLHDMGIIIFLSGHGINDKDGSGGVPMGFMLNPDHEHTIIQKIEALRTKQITMADIKEL